MLDAMFIRCCVMNGNSYPDSLAIGLVGTGGAHGSFR